MTKITLKELSAELTPEEWQELEAAESRQHVIDEDCPGMTDEQLMQFRRMNPN